MQGLLGGSQLPVEPRRLVGIHHCILARLQDEGGNLDAGYFPLTRSMSSRALRTAVRLKLRK